MTNISTDICVWTIQVVFGFSKLCQIYGIVLNGPFVEGFYMNLLDGFHTGTPAFLVYFLDCIETLFKWQGHNGILLYTK